MYKLLSHNDLDGVGCGILAKLAFGKQVKVRYNSVSNLDREVVWFLENDDKNTLLFITDLSVNKENEQKLNDFYQITGNVQLIDHHKTSLHFNEYEWGHVLVEDEQGKLTSATSLFYHYLVSQQLLESNGAISEFVELVRQYDTWEWERNENFDAQRLNALFYLISIEEFEEKMIERLKIGDRFNFDDFEKKLLDMEENKIERYIKRKKKEIVQAKIGEYLAGIVYAESYHSELGNELGKAYPHLDYIVILNMGGKRVGYRTVHDHVDVSEIAGKYGGGGHAKASGSSLTDAAYTQFVTDTFKLDPIREDAQRNRYNLKKSSFGSLYKNIMEETFFIHSISDQEWKIDHNNHILDQKFASFDEVENFLKRNYSAWLVRDDTFVAYLMNHATRVKKNE
ncbi:DHH family phosphoesterase [Paenisporosarcina sp. NPDC076898]|uniref:DHH family phosphoesterase n=1 Tax=unclassified Paenisporosarcina TaxID=2642018 RepID=UPI003D0647B2